MVGSEKRVAGHTMQLREMLQDDDAVSPVIGVILMVAITVILAAVIASFVLGLGPGEAAPTASFDFEGGSGEISVTHAQGDKIDVNTLEVQFEHQSAGTSGTVEVADTSGYSGPGSASVSGMSNSEVSSGTTVQITSLPDTGEYDVSVIYDGGDQTSTLDDNTVSVTP